MKNVRKTFAFAMALFMALAIAVPAIAQTVGTAAEGKGSITINNAANGETYSVVKIFGATLSADNKGIAYTGDIPADLNAYFEKDSTGNIFKKSGVADNDLLNAVQAYAKKQTATASETSDGSSLTFQGLDYGYYAVISTQGATVTVDSTTPNVTINDKNTKTVSVEKTVENQSYSIGDTINYTATVTTANYVSPENANPDGSDARQVVEYVVTDTLPEFLSNVSVDSIKIMDKTGKKELANVTAQFENKSLTIAWADDQNTNPVTYKSKYENGAQIVVKYHGTLTATANINTANRNTITITPNVFEPDKDTPQPWSEHWDDNADVKTYGAALKKTDGLNPLKGAKFAVAGLEVAAVANEPGVYKVVKYDSKDTNPGTEMSTNDEGKLYIIGLAETVTLKATETQAPDGYNKLSADQTVDLRPQLLETTLYETTGVRHYDADGNLLSESTNAKETKKVEKNYKMLDTANATEVVNKQGTEMPSTGGIGTTIFYVVGGVMVVGAVVFLLTKRRVNAE